MSETKEANHLELKRKSKKVKRTFNLFDFVVVKQKNKKMRQITTVKLQSKPRSKQIQKRGKIRKKRITTLKKRIVRERNAKQSEEKDPEETASDDSTEIVMEKIAQIQLDDPIYSKTILDDPSTQSEPGSIEQSAAKHSRNFREYCNHFITQEIKKLTELVLKDLLKFQENKFQKNPVKAKATKRYVVGFKEVKKFLVVKRLKLIVIAPDLERSSEVDALVEEIKSLADQNHVPYVFSVKRRHIGYLLLKKVPVSLVGVFDYQGTTENVNELLKYVQQESISYKNKIA